MTEFSKTLHALLGEETGMAEDEFTHETKLFSGGLTDSFTTIVVLA